MRWKIYIFDAYQTYQSEFVVEDKLKDELISVKISFKLSSFIPLRKFTNSSHGAANSQATK